MKKIKEWLFRWAKRYFNTPEVILDLVWDEKGRSKRSGQRGTENETFCLFLGWVLVWAIPITLVINSPLLQNEFLGLNRLLILWSSSLPYYYNFIITVVTGSCFCMALFKSIKIIEWTLQSYHQFMVWIVKEDEVYLSLQQKSFVKNDVFKKLSEMGTKKFLEKHFNKKGPGLVSFVEERMKIDRKFILFALSIPKKKELSTEALRNILKMYTGLEKWNEVKDLDLYFSNYSLEEIEKIFTMPGDRKFLLNLEGTQAFPVVKSFNDLVAKEIPKKLKKLEEKEGEWKFSVLKTPAEYALVSEEFSNCVRSRFNTTSFIVVARKEGVLPACIEFNSALKVTQMAGPRDQVSASAKELKYILKTEGFKVRWAKPHMF